MSDGMEMSVMCVVRSSTGQSIHRASKHLLFPFSCWCWDIQSRLLLLERMKANPHLPSKLISWPQRKYPGLCGRIWQVERGTTYSRTPPQLQYSEARAWPSHWPSFSSILLCINNKYPFLRQAHLTVNKTPTYQHNKAQCFAYILQSDHNFSLALSPQILPSLLHSSQKEVHITASFIILFHCSSYAMSPAWTPAKWKDECTSENPWIDRKWMWLLY